MNRLPIEVERLYGVMPRTADEPEPEPEAGTRAAVLSVSLPAGWAELAAVWRGVQADLDLPAPAIAVSGTDALQLWFSFARPVSASAAARFLAGLRARYLPDLSASQVHARSAPGELPATPGVEVGDQRWSAFITHDLAAVFVDTPWLDIPPGDDGQATILRGLEPMQMAGFEAALAQLDAREVADRVALPLPDVTATNATTNSEPRDSAPARFLSKVMNDETAPLALRIEAARILLVEANARPR